MKKKIPIIYFPNRHANFRVCTHGILYLWGVLRRWQWIIRLSSQTRLCVYMYIQPNIIYELAAHLLCVYIGINVHWDVKLYERKSLFRYAYATRYDIYTKTDLFYVFYKYLGIYIFRRYCYFYANTHISGSNNIICTLDIIQV